MQPATNSRVEYIDFIKGFSILWVVVFHLGSLPVWSNVPYRLPLFFFMSGIFFRQRPFKQFFLKRVNSLIIPLAFFYMIGLLVAVVKYDIMGSGVSAIGCVLDLLTLFNFSNNDIFAPLSVNIPLWFLLVLFHIQVIYYAIHRIGGRNKFFLLTLAAALTVAGLILKERGINGLFFLPRALTYLFYYVAGNVLGPKLMEVIGKRKNEWRLLGFCFPVLLVLSLLGYHGGSAVAENLLMNIRIACFIPIVFIFFKEFYRFVLLKPFRFLGRNSLTLLGTHLLVIDVISVLFIQVFHLEPAEFPMYKLLSFVLTLVVGYLTIRFLNRYLPWFAGKKELIAYDKPNHTHYGAIFPVQQMSSPTVGK